MNTEVAIQWLRENHLPGLNVLPTLPGWDLAAWTSEGGVESPGLFRNDRINSIISTNRTFFNQVGSTNQGFIDNIVDSISRTNWFKYYSPYSNQTNAHFVKKQLRVLLPSDIKDYQVNCSFVNCVAGTGATPLKGWGNDSGEGDYVSRNQPYYQGLFVEKGPISPVPSSETGQKEAIFNIYVFFSVPTSHMITYLAVNANNQGENNDHDTRLLHNVHNNQNHLFFTPPNEKSTEEHRSSERFSGFLVNHSLNYKNALSSEHIYELSRGAGDIYDDSTDMPLYKALRPKLVTYPTVEFSVHGLTQEPIASNYIADNNDPVGSTTTSVIT